jgi:hypothetical protein
MARPGPARRRLRPALLVLLAPKAGKYGGARRGHWLLCHVELLAEAGARGTLLGAIDDAAACFAAAASLTERR